MILTFQLGSIDKALEAFMILQLTGSSWQVVRPYCEQLANQCGLEDAKCHMSLRFGVL